MRGLRHLVKTGWMVVLALLVAQPLSAAADGDSLIAVEFAVYYAPKAQMPPLDIFVEEARRYPGLSRVADVPKERPTKPIMRAHVERNVRERYPVPDMAAMRYFARGIDQPTAQALQASEEVLIVDFLYPAAARLEAIKSAQQLMVAVAERTHGFLWDEETRELFSAEEWRRRRIDSWTEIFPDIAKHTVIHAYEDNGAVRAISLGMAKFGLPDIVVEDFAWSRNNQVGNLINFLGQTWLESGRTPAMGRVHLDTRSIQTRSVREFAKVIALNDPPGTADLILKAAAPEDGDPRNALVGISFDAYPGKDVSTRLDQLVSQLFGSAPDPVSRVKHDEELNRASEKARAQLPALAKRFREGLTPGEYLMLKAPFKTSGGGTEWMWVEVRSWPTSGSISGLLRNDPQDVPGLRAGQGVEIKEAQVFDYLLTKPDGSQEGNSTGAVIQAMQRS
jgi:uncharacterized protein YegJ (DUF2314 family)